jgi:hypothetical protein
MSIAVDATPFYFSEFSFYDFYPVPLPGIFSCPLDGCDEAEPESVVPDVTAFAIALSPTRLYYADPESGIVASVER